MVDMVIDFEDDEEGSCSSALEKIKETYPNNIVTFCNGGDRNKENIPEMKVSGIEFKFGVGGSDKKNSSSWILKDYKYPFEERSWGKFYNLFSDKKDIGVKIKELIVFPKQELSFQRHFHRSEIWFVSSGKCIVNYSEDKPEDANKIELSQEDNLCIQKEAWHQIINPFEEACHIIEIQYGDKTVEEDIEREVI